MEYYNEFSIGTRVRDTDGYCATVRYIGPVAVAKVILLLLLSSHTPPSPHTTNTNNNTNTTTTTL